MANIEQDMRGMFADKGLYIDIKYVDKFIQADKHKYDNSHLHDYYELYFNVDADVSFVVENKLYRVNPSDIVISLPNEFHNCVYHSNSRYKYFCMWFAADEQFKEYLSPFYEREGGSLVRIDKEFLKDFIESLEILERAKREDTLNSSRAAAAAFNILHILGKYKNSQSDPALLPQELLDILKYIDKNYRGDCSVKNLCEIFFISRSTIGRLFKKYLNTTPTKYVEDRRLSNAKFMLEKGFSVQDVCEQCGFSDYSHFIALFKKRFNITPLKYSKSSKF